MKASFLGKVKHRELTKSEFILSIVMVLIIESYIAYNYIIMPKWNTYKENSEKLSQRTELCDRLERENLNVKKLIENEKVLKYKLNKLARKLPPYISQEDILLTLGKYSKERDANIELITFDKDNIFTINNFFKKINSDDQQKSNSNNTSSVDQKVADKSPIVITKYINVKFMGSVASIYSFVDDLEKNSKKIVVKEIKIDRNKGNKLKGNMKLQYVAYKEDSNIPEFKIDMPKIDGKTSPFKPYDGYKSDDDEELSGYVDGGDSLPKSEKNSDIFLDINKSTDDMPKYVIGETGRPDTEVYFDLKDKIDGKLVIHKKGDKFIYTYTLGTVTKKIITAAKKANDAIKMQVNSNPVSSEDDMVSILLHVQNKTDSELQISVKNEDINMPRFILGDKSGKVTLK